MTKLYRGGSLIFDSEAVGEAASLTMLVDGDPAGSTVTEGADIGATRAGSVAEFDALGLGPLHMDVDGTSVATAPLSAVLAGTTSLTVPSNVGSSLRLRWGEGAGAITSQVATIEAAAAPAYTPNIVSLPGALFKSLSGYTSDRILVVGSFRVPAGETVGLSHLFEHNAAGGIGSVRIGNDGSLAVTLRFRDGAAAAQQITHSSVQAGASGDSFANDDLIAIVAAAEAGGTMRVRYSKNGGAWTLMKSAETLPAGYVPVIDGNWSVSKTNRTTEQGGFALYTPATIPSLSDGTKFADVSGWSADPAITRAYVGEAPILEQYGDAAAYTALTNTGSGGAWDSLSGVATDVPFEGGGGDTGEPNPFEGDFDITASQPSSLPLEAPEFAITGATFQQLSTWDFQWDMDGDGSNDWLLMSDLPTKYATGRAQPYGHRAAYAWSTPGTKNITCTCTPPVYTGLAPFTLTYAHTVASYAATFPTSGDVWHVSPSGSSAAFSGLPAGTQVTSMAAAWNGVQSNGGGLIYVDHTQETPITANMNLSSSFANQSKPVVIRSTGDPTNFAEHAVLNFVANDWRVGTRVAPPKGVHYCGLWFKGLYDPLNPTSVSRVSCVSPSPETPVCISYCQSSGNDKLVNQIDPANIGGTTGMVMFYETDMRDKEDYDFFVTTSRSVCVVGCRTEQNPLIPCGFEAKEPGQAGNYPDHGSGRVANLVCMLVYNCRAFNRTGWSPGNNALLPGVEGYKASNPIWRVGTTTMIEGPENNTSLNNNWCEGPAFSGHGGSGAGVAGRARIVMDGNRLMSIANSAGNPLGIGHTDVTMVNNIVIIPNCPSESANSHNLAGIAQNGGNAGGSADWENGETFIAGNTLAYMRDATNNANSDPTEEELMTEAELIARQITHGTSYVYEGNVLWVPNVTLDGASGPIVPAGGMTGEAHGPDPLYDGLRQEQSNGSITFLPEYANPAGSSIKPVPNGNPTMTPTTGMPARDYDRNLRPATPTMGAIEKAPVT